MRILLACLLLPAACGPIYPQRTSQDPPAGQEPAPEPQPPGMTPAATDPYDAAHGDPSHADQWSPAGGRKDPRIGYGQMRTPEQVQPVMPMHPPPAEHPQLSSDTQQLVDAHNAARARHCAAPLTWSPVLAAAAQRQANNLRDRNCAFEHTPNNPYGENLAGGTSGYLDPNAVVAMWYGEASKYDFKRPGFSMETGHFSQLVWKATTQLGCARSTCTAQNQDIWVCEYDPAGNWEGQYPPNVAPVGCR